MEKDVDWMRSVFSVLMYEIGEIVGVKEMGKKGGESGKGICGGRFWSLGFGKGWGGWFRLEGRV